MDSIAQFLMGAAVGQAVLGPKNKAKGALIGGLAGSVQDLDVLLIGRSTLIEQFILHRGFSHSFIFCVIVALLLAFGSQKLKFIKASFSRWTIFWFLVFFTHVLLDLCTTWGTQILWPNPTRFSLDCLFIIDPIVWLILIISCILAKIKAKPLIAKIGVFLIGGYICLSLLFQQYIHYQLKPFFKSNQMIATKVLVRPTAFNIFYWSVTVVTPSDNLLMGYVHVFKFSDSLMWLEPLKQNTHLLKKYHAKDLAAFIKLTKGFYVLSEKKDELWIHDARFGMIGGWQQPKKPRFVFNYILNPKTGTFTQHRDAMPDAGELLKDLAIKVFCPTQQSSCPASSCNVQGKCK